ncbi:hypothetical protein CsSME_00010513 [Camellia sinensis var. sinensis]
MIRESMFWDCTNLPGLKSQEAKITIIDDVSGIIKPGRCKLFYASAMDNFAS